MKIFTFALFGLLFLQACGDGEAAKNEEETQTTDGSTALELIGVQKDIDWQAHRGGRGLMPENSVASFLNALNFKEVTTLELDLVVSKDRFLVVSHEPWMSPEICKTPEKKAIEGKEYNIYEMRYIDIINFDCGSGGNERFPEQKKLTTKKPRLGDVVVAVESMIEKRKLNPVNYNIEIKSSPEGDRIYHPTPNSFATLVVEQINTLGIKNRVTVQSFDPRALQEVRKLDASIATALLIENDKSLEENINNLGFTPTIYSPNENLVTRELVAEAHQNSMKVIPWTVNEVSRMKELMALDVDGIITDYPDRIGKAIMD